MMRLAEQDAGKAQLAVALGYKSVSGALHRQIHRLLEIGLIEMTFQDKPNSRLQKYRLTGQGRQLNATLSEVIRNEYDCDIKRIAAEFNRHLSDEHGYFPLDWRVIKAIAWTESGGPAKGAWRGNPMQIGNSGGGLERLVVRAGGGELIMPADLKKRLSVTSARGSPQMNIRG